MLSKGWNDEAQAFTTAYDGLDLDAASLHIGLSGLIDPRDERFAATVTAIEAEQLFQQLVDVAGPTGLLSEEYDPVAERSLGNHPQAYSHLGLIRCAQLLNS